MNKRISDALTMLSNEYFPLSKKIIELTASEYFVLICNALDVQSSMKIDRKLSMLEATRREIETSVSKKPAIATTGIPKKRGRPPKALQVAVVQQPVAKKRGRKPKVQAQVIQQPIVQKRKRGRPRKVIA